MDILAIYAIAAGGILMSLLITRALKSLTYWSSATNVFVSRHIAYPYVLGRHQFWGPWTRASVLFHAIYLTVNLFLLFFKSTSISIAGRRAGTLSLINMVFLLASWHLSYLADLLGIYLKMCRRIHRAAGYMVIALLAFHVGVMLQSQGPGSLENDTQRLFTIIVS